MSFFDLSLGNNPTELGAVYAAYRALGYSDVDAAVLAQEEYLDRPLTADERAAFAASLTAGGGVLEITAQDVGEAAGGIVSSGGAGFFSSLDASGWVLVVGGAALVGGAAYVALKAT